MVSLIALLSLCTVYYKSSYDKLIVTHQSTQEELVGSIRALEECHVYSEASLKALDTLCIENITISSTVSDVKSEVSKEFDKRFTDQLTEEPIKRFSKLNKEGVVTLDENKDIITNSHLMLPISVDRLLSESYNKIYLRQNP